MVVQDWIGPTADFPLVPDCIASAGWELGAIRTAVTDSSGRDQHRHRASQIRRDSHFEGILGNSPQLLKLLDRVESAAPTGANVLIIGETGSGKELIARAI